MLVVDASALTELILGRPAGDVVGEHLVHHRLAVHAPHLVDVEVLSALRRLVASGETNVERAGEAIADLQDLPIERYPHDILVTRIWQLRENFSVTTRATSPWRRVCPTNRCRSSPRTGGWRGRSTRTPTCRSCSRPDLRWGTVSAPRSGRGARARPGGTGSSRRGRS